MRHNGDGNRNPLAMESTKTPQAEHTVTQNATTIADLVPKVKDLSRSDKLLLIQMIVQEMIATEIGADRQTESASAKANTSELIREDEDSRDLEAIKAFLKKPAEERKRIMAEQAEAMQFHYEQNTEWKEWLAGDIVEY